MKAKIAHKIFSIILTFTMQFFVTTSLFAENENVASNIASGENTASNSVKQNSKKQNAPQFDKKRPEGSSEMLPQFSTNLLPTSLLCITELEDQIELHNTELRSLRQDYAQALLDVKDAKAGMGPNIELTVAAMYLTNPPIKAISLDVDELLNNINWGGIAKPESGQHIKLYDGMENTYYSFQLELTQPIFTWGKLTNAVKLYEEVSNIRKLQITSRRKQFQTELYTRIVSLYYLSQIQNLLKKQDEYASRLVDICEKAQKNGLLLEQDVLDAKINALQIDITQNSVQEQYDNVLLGLQRLTGNNALSQNDIDFCPDDESFTEFASLDRTELEKKALSKERESFLILNSLQSVSAYAKKIANASVYWKPDIAFKASIGYGGSRFPFVEQDWFRKDDYTANFTLGIKTTVWDGGKKLNDIKRNASKQEVAAINYDDGIESIRQNLIEQFNTIDLSLTKIEYQKLKMQTLDSKVAQQEQLFASGYGDESDLLQAKIDRNTAEIELIQNKLSLASAVYTAKFLCGDFD